MKIEIRDNNVHISGYVNAVDRDSLPIPDRTKGRFVEKVVPKTFERALHKNPVELRFNHRDDKVITDTTNDNFKLVEDNIGLYADVITDDPDIIDAANNNRLRGWSFGFDVPQNGDTWTTDTETGINKRALNDINLHEVSLLTLQPAYPACSIEIREENPTLVEYRDFEDQVTESKKTEESEQNESEAEERNSVPLELYKQIIEIMKLKRSNT